MRHLLDERESVCVFPMEADTAGPKVEEGQRAVLAESVEQWGDFHVLELVRARPLADRALLRGTRDIEREL